MIIIVLIYNYISKRLVLFKKKPETVKDIKTDNLNIELNSKDLENDTANNNKDNKK